MWSSCWLGTSEAHTQASQAYNDIAIWKLQGITQAIWMIWNEWCFAQSKERELERQVDQTQTQGYVSRFEPLALRPRLHREGFLIHYIVHRGLPPREPPPRRICTTREYRTPLSTLQCHRGNTTTIHLYRRGIRPVANNQTPPHKRGSKPNEGFYNKWYISTTNPFPFPQTKRS